MHENYGQIGRNITSALKAKGKTQLWLSKQSGIDSSSVSKYMRGQIIPSLYNAIRLCKVLDINLDELVKGWIYE